MASLTGSAADQKIKTLGFLANKERLLEESLP